MAMPGPEENGGDRTTASGCMESSVEAEDSKPIKAPVCLWVFL